MQYITLQISLDRGIPQIGDESWVNLPTGEKVHFNVLTIESVIYDGRLKLNITYGIKITNFEQKRLKLVK